MPLPSIRFRFSNEIRQAGAFHVCTALTRYRRRNDTMKIQCTSDYSKFQHLTGNRPVDTKRVQRIAKLMREVGFLPSYHIVVNSNMEIADGQHRFEAAKAADVPVYFIVDDTMQIETIQKAGSLNEKWSASDHITARAEQGNVHYQQLLVILAKSKFVSSITLEVIARAHSSRMKCLQLIKDGSFEITPEFTRKYEEIYTRLMDIDAVSSDFLQSKYAVYGALSLLCHPLYEHKRLKEKLGYQSTRLVRCISPTEYTDLIYSIYNFKVHPKNAIEPIGLPTSGKNIRK